jgi:hypothetical protein
MNKSPKDAGRDQGSIPEPKRKDRRSPSRQDWLGDQLRDLYGAYAEEPLPDELQSLLDRLDDSKPDGRGKGN